MDLETSSPPQPEMRFRPLTDGLGINHFADGSPYAAPNGTSRKVAQAGRATSPHNTGKTDAVDRTPQFTAPVFSSVASGMTGVSPRVSAAAFPQMEVRGVSSEGMRPASGFARFFSFLADIFFVSLGFVFIVWLGFYLNGMTAPMVVKLITQRDLIKGTTSFGDFLMPFLLLYFVISVGYFVVQEVTWHRTLGKALFGLRIEAKSTMSILGRIFCFMLAALPLGLGFIWYFFDSRKRCWHDVVSDSDVLSYSSSS